jgi:hypothetical protein
MQIPVSPLVSYIRKYLLAFLFAFVWSACTYDPGNEITVRQIEKANPVSTLVLPDFKAGDTVFLFQTTDIKFKVGVDKGEIKGVRLSLRSDGANSVLISSEPEGLLRIYVGYGGLSTGVYTATVEIESTAATNSIADRLGKEIVTTVQTFPIKVDTEPPPVPKITLSESNGFLKASWKPYLKKNFKAYHVSYGIESGYYTKKLVLAITDPQKTFVIDSNYVTGHPVEFQVVTETVAGLASDKVTYFSNPNKLEMSYSFTDSMVNIKWNKPTFKGAFKSYTIGNGGASPLAEISNINDTTFSYKADAVLGLGANVFVIYKTLRDWYAGYSLSASVNETVESQTLNFPGRLSYNSSLGKLFAFDWVTRNVNAYNLDFTLASQAQISGGADPYIADAGAYGYHINGLTVVRFDLLSGAETSHDELSSIPNTNITSASADGIITMAGTIRLGGNPPTPFTQLKQFGSDVFIHFQAPFYNEPLTYSLVSGNGKYVHFPNQGHFKRLENGVLTMIGENLFNIIAFRPDNNEELITRKLDGSVVILNASDLSVKRTIPIPQPSYSFRFYDPVTNTVLFDREYSDVRYIVSVETGNVVMQFKSTIVRNYINGTIFIDYGKCKKLL